MKKKTIVIHPFLFAVFPILFLYSHNVDEVRLSETVGPVLLGIVLTLLLLSGFRLLLRNQVKAGIAVSLFWVLFFSFTRVYDVVGERRLWHFALIGSPSDLLLLWLLLSIIGGYCVITTRRTLRNLTRICNVASLVLIMLSLTNVALFAFKAVLAPHTTGSRFQEEIDEIEIRPVRELPHIFYIIVDGYAREDILSNIYDFDNGAFLDSLREKGFYVADKSSANYCQTTFSLASSLNVNYLDDLVPLVGTNSDNREPLCELIQQNRVVRILRKSGYLFTAFATGYRFTEVPNADRYLSPGWLPGEFGNILLSTTPIPDLLSMISRYDPYETHRELLRYICDHIDDLAGRTRPHFVFAHIMAPHPPFVFGPDGEHITPHRSFALSDGSHFMRLKGASRDEYISHYRGQLSFVNTQIQKFVDAIIAHSKRPPVIIIQADHGPGAWLDWKDINKTNLKERLTILNACYIPDGVDIGLYEGITPVNTFRLIFNYYLGTDFELLEDKSYFALWDAPYKLIDVTENIFTDTDFSGLEVE